MTRSCGTRTAGGMSEEKGQTANSYKQQGGRLVSTAQHESERRLRPGVVGGLRGTHTALRILQAGRKHRQHTGAQGRFAEPTLSGSWAGRQSLVAAPVRLSESGQVGKGACPEDDRELRKKNCRRHAGSKGANNQQLEAAGRANLRGRLPSPGQNHGSTRVQKKPSAGSSRRPAGKTHCSENPAGGLETQAAHRGTRKTRGTDLERIVGEPCCGAGVLERIRTGRKRSLSGG